MQTWERKETVGPEWLSQGLRPKEKQKQRTHISPNVADRTKKNDPHVKKFMGKDFSTYTLRLIRRSDHFQKSLTEMVVGPRGCGGQVSDFPFCARG